MNFDNVYKELYKLTSREKYYREKNSQLSADYYNRLKTKNINGKQAYIFDNLDLIPAGQNFNVIKHTRFVPVPLHVHNFIELNYIYSGSCTQVIDGKTVNLKQGQICLVDTDVPHSISNTNINDIIINIVVKRDYFLHQLNRENYNGGVVFDFVLNALSESQNHNQYIVFENSEDKKIKLIINQIIEEHLNPGIGSNKIIENLISILFTMLVRIFNYQTNKQNPKSRSDVVPILQYIDQNYQNLSLNELSKYFNYNPSYISTLIKKATGRTLSNLLTELRLERAESLINNTDKSIRECAESAGFSNISFFYRKYQEKYNHLPSKNR